MTKSFVSIPGPKAIPLLGTLHNYLPFIGKYSFNRLHRTGYLKYLEYGPLVRENLMKGVNLLFVFHPEDIAEVLANDGRYPFRRSHMALQKYRLERPEMYTCGGLLPTNGEEWWRIRREAQKVMTKIPCVRSHLPVVNQICIEFIGLVQEIRSGDEIHDFLPLLKKLFLELTMQTTVDHRFYCLKPHLEPESEAAELLWAGDASTKSILRTDNGIPLWKWFQTPLYKQLTRSQDAIYRIALKYVQKKEKEMEKNPAVAEESSISPLEYFISHRNLSKKDVLTLVCDALLAGTDTSSYSSAFMLYHLATNPEKQEKLSAEATLLLSENQGIVSEEILNKAVYTKAVVKESLRLNPISVGIGRTASKDFVLRGHKIPQGTVIVTQNQVSCRFGEYFEEPNRFIPERWLSKDFNRKNAFLLLPFGHGPRSCIGRRLAEQNIYCFLLQMFARFRISWKGRAELDCYSHLINEPDAQLRFKFENK